MTKNKFHFTINDGPEQTITMKSGVYVQVVAALPGVLGIDQDAYPLTIKIWVPDLLPEYGPYTYYIDAAGGRCGSVHKRWDDQIVVSYSTA